MRNNIQNAEPIQNIEDAHSGKGFNAENVDDLLKQLED